MKGSNENIYRKYHYVTDKSCNIKSHANSMRNGIQSNCSMGICLDSDPQEKERQDPNKVEGMLALAMNCESHGVCPMRELRRVVWVGSLCRATACNEETCKGRINLHLSTSFFVPVVVNCRACATFNRSVLVFEVSAAVNGPCSGVDPLVQHLVQQPLSLPLF